MSASQNLIIAGYKALRTEYGCAVVFGAQSKAAVPHSQRSEDMPMLAGIDEAIDGAVTILKSEWSPLPGDGSLITVAGAKMRVVALETDDSDPTAIVYYRRNTR